jgi:hypothetical protein
MRIRLLPYVGFCLMLAVLCVAPISYAETEKEYGTNLTGEVILNDLKVKQGNELHGFIDFLDGFDKSTLAEVPSEAKSSETVQKFDINSIIKNLNF